MFYAVRVLAMVARGRQATLLRKDAVAGMRGVLCVAC